MINTHIIAVDRALDQQSYKLNCPVILAIKPKHLDSLCKDRSMVFKQTSVLLEYIQYFIANNT